MRKTIEILMAVVTVLLFVVAAVSCRHTETTLRQAAAQRFAGGFGCTAQVSLGSGKYTVQVSRSASGQGTMSFTQPAALSTLSFRTGDDGAIDVRFNGLETTVSAASLPQSGIFDAILGAIETVRTDKGVAVRRTGQNFLVTGKTAAGSYRLTLKPDGTPLSLEFPVLKLKAVFQDFQFT